MNDQPDHFTLFQTGAYHRHFQQNHIHWLRSAQLRSSYGKSLMYLRSLGWPDPLAREAPRLLLCGTASAYTTLTFVRFVRQHRQDIQLDVLDIAAYPLQQSQHFLQRCRDLERASIAFVECNALRTPFRESCFDWIETDFFLQFFSPAEKKVLFQEWYRLLKPGGIVTTRDWLLQKDNLIEKCAQYTKSWLVRHTLGPVTYPASLTDVRAMLSASGFVAAFFPTKIFQMQFPLLTSILLYKPLQG